MQTLITMLLTVHALGYQGIMIEDTASNLKYLQDLGLTQWHTKPETSTFIVLPYGFEEDMEYSYTYGGMSEHTDYLYMPNLEEDLQSFTEVMVKYTKLT